MSDPFRSDAPLVIALIGGRVAQVGDSVRLHPSARADAFDLLLADKIARIEAIQQDYEDRVYFVVTLDDDPGREQPDERVLPGHRFYFFPDEVELVDERQPSHEGPSQTGGSLD
jgi:hypothetical protein